LVRCIVLISYLAYPPNKARGVALAPFLSTQRKWPELLWEDVGSGWERLGVQIRAVDP
jgi:hypothetical protein